MNKHLEGAAASEGVAIGPALVLREHERPEIAHLPDPGASFDAAVAAAVESLSTGRDRAAAEGREDAADILGAQMLMAEDPMLIDEVRQRITAGANVGEALYEVGDQLSEMLAAMDDEYLAARSADVTEVVDRIGRALAGEPLTDDVGLSEPSIVVATELTAAATATLDPTLVLGFATEQGGPTSHVAVIARSLGIPAVVGLEGLIEQATGSTTAAIDGGAGELVLDPDDDTKQDFANRRDRHEERRASQAAYRGKSVAFADRAVTVAANVGGPGDVERAADAAADGIGLFRTEFLFLDRSNAPTEEEQFEAYREAAERFDHPVVIRTFDIGGDKPAPYLSMEHEENPFLGVRGVRLYQSAADLFISQIRAALRAASHGDVWLMIPMVATVADALEVRKAVSTISDQLADEGTEHGSPKVGIMVEVPSAALIGSQLANVVDFFSIGTNDLTQYALAVDRTSGALAGYSDAAHPAVLRLCHMTALAASAAGIPAAVCGEAAGDPVTAALYMGMGIGKLSVAPTRVDGTRALIDHLSPDQVSDVLAKALAATSADDVRELVDPLVS